MKTVYFVRHAKSSWDNISLDDADRPLSNRGVRDAPFMAKLFAAKERMPDVIYSSPAVRAYTTATVFAEIIGFPIVNIQQDPNLYLGSEDYIINKIQTSDNDVGTICFFGHNPTTTHLANIFSSNDYIPNVPTAAIVKIQANVSSWKDFDSKQAQFVTMHYPKEYLM